MARMSATSDEVLIEPLEALLGVRHGQPLPEARLDVRSEGEFRQGALPGFVNAPILTDPERHEVGLTYKRDGQEQAIRLGYDLVGPVREQRVAGWLERVSPGCGVVVTCWRGGLRSRIASEWIRERGVPVFRVREGTKGMRSECLKALAQPPEVLVLAGMTGSGKTRLLEKARVPKIDLEGLARHRGSSFGRILGQRQPSQQTFENAVGLELLRAPGVARLVEDESTHIGGVVIPSGLRHRLRQAPLVLLEVPEEGRARFIFEMYVEGALQAGHSPAAVLQSFSEALTRIRSKLGGLRYEEVSARLHGAFRPGRVDAEAHLSWISLLLRYYYDPMYRFALESAKRPVAFRGNEEDCLQWIEKRWNPSG